MPPKNKKGKQKEEKPVSAREPVPPPLAATERVNVTAMPPAEPPQQTHPPDTQAATWGGTAGETWGTSGPTWGQSASGDTWGAGPGTTQEVQDTWDQSNSLLHPPQTNPHHILPTIPETQSGHASQNGTYLSDHRSQDEYSDNWENNHDPRSQNWDERQSRTLTPTAAASLVNSPNLAPNISIAEAAAAAEKEIHKQQKFSSASEAARRLEEARFNIIPSPMATQQITALAAQPTTAHKPMSSASAAAAEFEANLKRTRKPPTTQAQSVNSHGKTSWTYPKPFLPGAREPASIPGDLSWTMTGGNAWSNKHRAPKGASTGNWPPPANQSGWEEQLRQYRQAEAAQQARLARQQRTAQQKHQPLPGHPMHQRHRQPTPQKQSWQAWGKRNDWEQSEETESDSEAETLNGWDHTAGSAWGQGADDQGGGGSAWGQTAGGSAWGQNAGGWGQTAAGGWDQIQQPAMESRHEQKRGRGHAPDRKTEAPPGDEWGQIAGAEWGQGGGGGGRGRQEKDGWKPASAWGEATGGNAWGSQGQQHDDRGATGGGVWGQGQGQGNTGWGQTTNNGWGTAAEGGEWGGQPAANAEWGGEAQRHKVAFAASEAAGSRNVLSPQQRSQILNSLLTPAQNQPVKSQQPGHATATAVKHQSLPQQHKHAQGNWEPWEAQDTGWGSDESDGEYDASRRVRFSPKASELWGGSPRSVPSKTLTHAQAQQGITTTLINDTSNVRFVDSRGAGLAFVANAFFGNSRLARERIYWMFPENKDERVAAMIAWVQKMSFNLATYGLMKFLETRERGALFVNAVFRMSQHPHEPAFDWLTFNQLQGTMDKTLQASVAFSDPSKMTLVFVFLPSQSGNSVAIWRRKVNIPDAARLKYQADINGIIGNLRTGQEYQVLIDEIPKPKPPAKSGTLRKSVNAKSTAKATATKPHPKPHVDKKRKWWKFFLS